jgi:hypothetical protein
VLSVRGPDEFDGAFSAIGKLHAQALSLGHPDPIFHVHARENASWVLTS